MGRNYKEMPIGFADDGTGPQTNTDSRTPTTPQTRATAFSGGGGITLTPRSNPKPFTGFPIIPKTPQPSTPKPAKDLTIEVAPPPVATPPAEEPKAPKSLPAKDPQPQAPIIPAATKGNVGVNAKRYSIKGDSWQINAKPEGVGPKPNITPLSFRFGSRPELKPLLRVDGVVVKVGNDYLVSPQTLADIRDSQNPHYDIVENGRIGNTAMGKTVPVVEITTSGLEATGSRRDVINSFAGVKSVDYTYETPTVMGVPEGIVEQINYTLDPNTQRPEDTFELWQMNLTGDYTIEKLKTDTAQADGKLDKEKLAKFTKGVGERLKILQKDLNIIKGIFYRGELAEADRKAYIKLTKRAMADTTEEEAQKPETSQYVVKTTEVVAHEATPNSTKPTETGTAEPPADVSAETLAAELPEIKTSTTDGTIPKEINTAGLETSKLLNDWNSYGFTPQEKAELKTTVTNRMPYIICMDKTRIGIGGVRWSPRIADKARVILPYTQRPENINPFGMSIMEGANLRRKWTEYYGTSSKRFELNKLRIAELLNLTQKIKELENKNSKTY